MHALVAYRSACMEFRTFIAYLSFSLSFAGFGISLEPTNDDVGAAEHNQEQYFDQPGKHVSLLMIFL